MKSRVLIPAVGGKALVIPENGWNAQSFAAHGEAMILTLARVAKITQRRAAPIIARKAKTMFRRQVTGICNRVLQWSGQRRKAVFNLGPNAELWVEAINEVFAEANLEAVATLMPDIQRTIARGYSNTSVILGQPAEDVSKVVTAEAREIAQRITRISETTRNRIIEKVVDGTNQGLSIPDMVEQIEAAAPEIYGHRALTIARTETNTAWLNGSVRSMLESETLTHVSVIGCESREVDRWGSLSYPWMWHEESTCNYEDVPIHELEEFAEIGFHPNHTGNIVPSGFRNDDGSITEI